MSEVGQIAPQAPTDVAQLIPRRTTFIGSNWASRPRSMGTIDPTSEPETGLLGWIRFEISNLKSEISNRKLWTCKVYNKSAASSASLERSPFVSLRCAERA